MGDHHEGPFSLAEIQTKIGSGAINSGSFVWAEGMIDWKLMREVPAFESILKKPTSSPVASNGHSDDIVLMEQPPSEPKIARAKKNTASRPAATKITIDTAPLEPKSRDESKPKIEIKDELDLRVPTPPMDDRLNPKRSRIKTFFMALVPLFVLALGVAHFTGMLAPLLEAPSIRAVLKTAQEMAEPALMKLSEKLPVLSKWISPIPRLEGVDPAEYAELKKAAMIPLSEGPRLALALSRTDPLAPYFYVTSNLPSGTVVEITIEGVSETLLGQLTFRNQVEAVIEKQLGRSEVVRFPDGRPVPRGEYTIVAIESSQQPPEVAEILLPLTPSAAKVPQSITKGFKLVSTKRYFLGGERDDSYITRLKEFHDKIIEKAQKELTEVQQFLATLELQLNSTNSKFSSLYSASAQAKPKQKKVWSDFHENEFRGLSEQIQSATEKFNPDFIQKEAFYGILYQLTHEASQTILELHESQNAYFTSTMDLKAYVIQLGEKRNTAESALARLRATIQKARSIPPAPNGMPRRDGLDEGVQEL